MVTVPVSDAIAVEVEVGQTVVEEMTPPETNKGSCQDLEVATETVMDPDPVIPTATALPTQTPITTQEIVMDEVRIEIIIIMEVVVPATTIEVKVTVLIITTTVTATNIGAMIEIVIEKKSPFTLHCPYTFLCTDSAIDRIYNIITAS